ncbi:MAG: DsbA family protein [bacterium]
MSGDQQGGPSRPSALQWIIPLAIIIAGALIILSLQSARKVASPPPSPPPPPAASPPPLASPPPETDSTADIVYSGLTKGLPTATLIIEEYSDFQCPACQYFWRNIEPDLDKEFVATGKVRFVFRPYSFIGPESIRAAEAATCAADQNKFWPYHDALFTSQRGENEGTFSDGKLKRIAADLSLDAFAFNKCLESKKHRSEVLQQKKDGDGLGINTTPTLVIYTMKDGQLKQLRQLVGSPREFSDFRAIVNESLAAAAGP